MEEINLKNYLKNDLLKVQNPVCVRITEWWINHGFWLRIHRLQL